MLETDPDKRPNLWQISEAMARIRGVSNRLPNVFVSMFVFNAPVNLCLLIQVKSEWK